jgi:outer membrane lipoprotein-sorting protein
MWEDEPMRVCSIAVLMSVVMAGACSFAAEPTTVEELKAYFTSVAGEVDTFTADYKMSMDMAAAGQPAPPGMAAVEMGGKLLVNGESMRMDMGMEMPMGDQTMVMKIQMLMKDGFMNMLMDMNGMVQAMKMDMTVLAELAESLGVPASTLNSSDMGMGMMGNPAKMLEEFEKTSTLTLKGKDTVDGEEVYVLTSTLKDEIMENFEKLPALQQQAGMLEAGATIYLGASDGIMRKMEMGDFMTMTLENIDLEAEISDADLEVIVPDGIQVIDMTEMMKAMFGNMAASGDLEE